MPDFNTGANPDLARQTFIKFNINIMNYKFYCELCGRHNTTINTTSEICGECMGLWFS